MIGNITLEHWPKLALNTYNKENNLDFEEELDNDVNENSKIIDETDESMNGKIDEVRNEKQCENVENSTNENDNKSTEQNNSHNNHSINDKKISENGENNNKSNVDEDIKDSLLSSNDKEEKVSSSNVKSLDTLVFNEDLVCPHNLQCPSAQSHWLPASLVDEITQLCEDAIHPATLQDDFDICPDCLVSISYF